MGKPLQKEDSSSVHIHLVNNAYLMLVRVAQILLLATIALLISSLATIAIPKLVGQLIDTCIKYSEDGYDREHAQNKLNGEFISV